MRVPCLMTLVLVCALPATSLADTAAVSAPLTLSVEPSKTRVGIARVHLLVDDLKLVDGVLEGRYSIQVPLLPSKNDSGTIRLDVADPLERLRHGGAVLKGQAESAQDGTRRAVTCDVQGDGRLRIEILMEDRTLSFRTRYRTIG